MNLDLDHTTALPQRIDCREHPQLVRAYKCGHFAHPLPSPCYVFLSKMTHSNSSDDALNKTLADVQLLMERCLQLKEGDPAALILSDEIAKRIVIYILRSCPKTNKTRNRRKISKCTVGMLSHSRQYFCPVQPLYGSPQRAASSSRHRIGPPSPTTTHELMIIRVFTRRRGTNCLL
jgi:hypothetical protein